MWHGSQVHFAVCISPCTFGIFVLGSESLHTHERSRDIQVPMYGAMWHGLTQALLNHSCRPSFTHSGTRSPTHSLTPLMPNISAGSKETLTIKSTLEPVRHDDTNIGYRNKRQVAKVSEVANPVSASETSNSLEKGSNTVFHY